MKIAQPTEQALPLATTEARAMQVAAPSPIQMMQAMIAGGVTEKNVAAFEKLAELQWRFEEREAEKQFAAAFMELQKELPRVKATKIIPDRNGGMRSSFAPFEEIDSQLRPIVQAHGFTYSFAEGPFDSGRITKICTVQHFAGHKRSNPFSVRIGSGPPGCSEAQADGAAHSYAKRGALCDAFNIVVTGIDNDAKLEGNLNAKVSKDQCIELKHRVEMLQSNVAAFLKFAGADSFENIPAKNYDVLDRFLQSKEKAGK
jgi:hypothetical protein